MERDAMAEAMLTVALSRSDAEYLNDKIASYLPSGGGGVAGDGQKCLESIGQKAAIGTSSENSRRKVEVLLCALREDMRSLPVSLPQAGSTQYESAAVEFAQSRPYLTCCVRLSPEKEPHRFVELVEELAHRGVFESSGAGGLVPLMIGSAKDEYAEVR